MHDYFGCEVHGFDPSPVSLEWIQTSEMMNKTRFHFHPYGAGGVDGQVDLYKYDWGQVSIIRNVKNLGEQSTFPLPVKTLATIMKELGHTDRILDVMKVDVEGSEYQFLEEALDTLGTLPTKQLTVEWHHYAFDPRYGGGSSPQINALVTMLHESGLKQFWRHHPTGWPDPASKEHWEKVGLNDVRYNLASFHREDEHFS
jgi:FkbM family methyltransferase